MVLKKLFALVVLLAVTGVALLFAAPGVVLSAATALGRTVAGLSLREVVVAGHRMPYLTGGEGETLLLLHGFGGDKDNWVQIARFLTPHLRVVAPDLPGFGDATRDPDARYTIDEQVARVDAFADELGLASFHLGGNSMGGQIAGAYAARHPARVKTLWLLAPAGVLSAKRSEFIELLEEEGDNPLLVDTPEKYARMLSFAMASPPNLPGPILRALAVRAIERASFNERIFRQLVDDMRPLEKTIAGLRVPTLVVWGTNDRLLHFSGARILGDALPRATVVVLPRVGHVPMAESPERCAEDFLRFAGQAAGLPVESGGPLAPLFGAIDGDGPGRGR